VWEGIKRANTKANAVASASGSVLNSSHLILSWWIEAPDKKCGAPPARVLATGIIIAKRKFFILVIELLPYRSCR
jgi:hypothetical protein